MKIEKIKDKVEVLDVNGQDCFLDCKTTVWNGNRNSTDNNGSCTSSENPSCKFTCDW